MELWRYSDEQLVNHRKALKALIYCWNQIQLFVVWFRCTCISFNLSQVYLYNKLYFIQLNGMLLKRKETHNSTNS